MRCYRLDLVTFDMYFSSEGKSYYYFLAYFELIAPLHYIPIRRILILYLQRHYTAPNYSIELYVQCVPHSMP